jgi:hypothetical protein
MEEATCDQVQRKAARQTTRRETLGALVGSALLLSTRGEIEATKKAERRKKRKKRQQRSASLYRGIAIEIDNKASDQPVVVNHGASGLGVCCKYHSDGIQPARSSVTYRTSYTTGWVRINNKYWFQFTNPPLTPYVKIAVNGKFPSSGGCCNVIADGQIVADITELSSGQSQTWNILNQAVVTVIRRPNARDHIQFKITLPPNLPQG